MSVDEQNSSQSSINLYEISFNQSNPSSSQCVSQQRVVEFNYVKESTGLQVHPPCNAESNQYYLQHLSQKSHSLHSSTLNDYVETYAYLHEFQSKSGYESHTIDNLQHTHPNSKNINGKELTDSCRKKYKPNSLLTKSSTV